MLRDLIRTPRRAGVAILVIPLLFLGCRGVGERSVGERVVGAPFGDPAELITWLRVTPTKFHAGETIQIEVGARNPTTRPVMMLFSDGCGLHYVVEDESDFTVQAFICPSNAPSYELAPGETLVRKYSWDGTSLGGTPLPPGEYSVHSRGVSTAPVTIWILAH